MLGGSSLGPLAGLRFVWSVLLCPSRCFQFLQWKSILICRGLTAGNRMDGQMSESLVCSQYTSNHLWAQSKSCTSPSQATWQICASSVSLRAMLWSSLAMLHINRNPRPQRNLGTCSQILVPFLGANCTDLLILKPTESFQVSTQGFIWTQLLARP